MSKTKKINVLLVGKYDIVQESLKHLVESNDGLSVAGLHTFDSDNCSDSCVSRSDVAVVYLSSEDQVEIVNELLNENPALRVVILVAGADLDSQAHALKLGAVGIVQIEQSPKMLMEAIRQTHAGETWLNQALLHKILERGRSPKEISAGNGQGTHSETLTTRELEVIKLLAAGRKNKELAKEMLVSEATIRHHLSSIYGKIGVDDRLNLVIYAYENGLAEVPRGVREKAAE
jgi:NarL family two-component system response regulator LiaR